MDLQLLLALTVTLLAILYLIWSVVRPWVGRKNTACGGCGSCGAAREPAGNKTTFVPIEGLTLRSSRSGG